MPRQTKPIKIPIIGVDMTSQELGMLSKRMKSWSKEIGSVGKKLSMSLTLPIVGAGVGMTLAATKMNEGMAKIGTLIPGNVDRLNELINARNAGRLW